MADQHSHDQSPLGGPELSGPSGVVEVRLGPVDRYFIEGFEVSLRFETADGAVVAAGRWSDAVRAAFVDGGRPEVGPDGARCTRSGLTLDSYYTHVLRQPVPAGTVVLWSTMSVGIGAGPDDPDPSGPLESRLVLDVEGGERVSVEVSLRGGPYCLNAVA